MDQETALTCIARFRDALEAKGIHVGRLVLYGSYATGQSHEGSDIDLVVVSDDFEGRGDTNNSNTLCLRALYCSTVY